MGTLSDLVRSADADSQVTARVKLAAGGTLFATAYCNIHGLWESEKAVQVA